MEKVCLALAVLVLTHHLLREETEVGEVDQDGCLWKELAGPDNIFPILSRIFAMEKLFDFLLLRSVTEGIIKNGLCRYRLKVLNGKL